MRKALCAAVLAIGILALGAGPASAATPFTAGNGSDPDVAVGFDGSAHVAWITGGDNAEVAYCRVSPGAESCGHNMKLTFPGATAANPTGRASVFVPSPGKIVIVAGCWNCPGTPSVSADKSFRWTSTNNGSSFGVTQIGRAFELNGVGTWIEDTNLFVAANSSSVMAQTLVEAAAVPVAIAPVGFSFDGEIVRVPGTDGLVAASNDLNSIGYRLYEGSLIVSEINDADNWSPGFGAISTAGASNTESSLAAGPTGVFIAYRSTAGGTSRLAVSHLNSATGVFEPPAYLQGDNPIDTDLQYPDSTMDLTGRLHLVWRSPGGGGRLRYRATDTGGTTFTPVGTLASGENFTEPTIAVGGETGFVVWTQGVAGPIRVVRVDPTYDAPPVAPPTTPPAPPKPDVTKPSIGKRSLRPGEGTTFRFTSNVAGEAVLTIEKRYAGIKGKRKGKKACLPRSKKRLKALRRKAKSGKAYRKLLKKKSCRAYRRIGEIRQPVKAGVNTITFDGRVAGRKLGRGAYRATLVVTNALGEASRTETLNFKVVDAKKKKKAARLRR